MAARNPGRSSPSKAGAAVQQRLEPIVSALCYAGVSVAIILFNKAVISSYAFKFSDVMVCCHMLTSVVLIQTLKYYNLIDLPDFDYETARKSMGLAIASVFNIVIGLEALDRVNLAMFTTLRRLTALAIIVLEYKVLHVIPDAIPMIGVGLMVLGSVLAGIGDLGFDMISYLFVVFNNVASAAYLVLMKTSGNSSMGHWTVFYYNCLCSLPFLLVICLVRGSFTKALQFPLLMHPPFIAAFSMSALLSFFLNYSTFWCTRTNSALTTSITGQTKNLLTTIFGMVLFDGISKSSMNLLGLTLSMLGSVIYAWTKLQQSQKRKSVSKIDEDKMLIPLKVNK